MIHRKHRFHGLHSLGFVMRRGDIIRGSGLALKWAPNPRQRNHRVAVVVSRKVSKSAVVRNRIRRRIFEVVREVENGITQPFDLVFLVREAGLAEVPTTELTGRIVALLEKSGALVGNHPSSTTGNHAIVVPKEKNT